MAVYQRCLDFGFRDKYQYVPKTAISAPIAAIKISSMSDSQLLAC